MRTLKEFLANVVWQHPAFRCPLRLKSRVVFFDNLVKKGLLRAMALVLRCTLAATGFPARWLNMSAYQNRHIDSHAQIWIRHWQIHRGLRHLSRRMTIPACLRQSCWISMKRYWITAPTRHVL